MKKIHLLRHAKSDWVDASLADIDRPLNARGIRTAKAMATELVKIGCTFEHVFCSTAVRAQSTITIIREQLADRNIQWQTEAALYTFESRHLQRWFQSLDATIDELLVIGHNPAFTNFCNARSNGKITNIPTCGYVQLHAKEPSTWDEVANTSFEVSAFLEPKTLNIL